MDIWRFEVCVQIFGPKRAVVEILHRSFPEMAEQKKVFLLKKLFLEFKSCCRYKIDLTMKGLEKWAHNLWLCLNYVLFDVTCPR